MSLETLRKYCNLCGSPLGESVEQVRADLIVSAPHITFLKISATPIRYLSTSLPAT